MTTANPNQGWRIAPTSTPLRRTEAGRFARDMEITHNGEHVAAIEHIYTGAEIEQLYLQMRTLYAEGLRSDDVDPLGFPTEDRRALTAEMAQWQ